MGFLKSRLLRRFTPFGRMTDLAMVAAAGLRFAQRRGIIDRNLLSGFGLGGDGDGKFSVTEMMLVGGAAWRLARKLLSRRRSQTIVIDA